MDVKKEGRNRNSIFFYKCLFIYTIFRLPMIAVIPAEALSAPARFQQGVDIPERELKAIKY